MRKVVFMIDGWFMRKRIYRVKSCLDPLRNPIQAELSEHVDFIATNLPELQKTQRVVVPSPAK